jgi:uncharacterized protein with GYD domain
MPKYLVQSSYNAEGAKGLLKEGGTARRSAAEKVLKSVGGKLESFYFAFGETDAFLIVEMPDNVAAASVSLAVAASGAVHIRTTPLLSCEEMDAAVKKHADYRKPGG